METSSGSSEVYAFLSWLNLMTSEICSHSASTSKYTISYLSCHMSCVLGINDSVELLVGGADVGKVLCWTAIGVPQ